MGSVSSIEVCSRCGCENYYEISYYRTGEFSNLCGSCGRNEQFFYKTDDQGNFLTKGDPADRSFGNLIEDWQNFPDAAGVCHIENSVGETMFLLNTEKIYADMKNRLPEFNENAEITAVYISRFDGEKIIKEVLKGEPNFHALHENYADEQYCPMPSDHAENEFGQSEIPF